MRHGKKIRLDLWDTAGQEKYRAIGRHFYKESYIVCLVYDITSKSSFENIKKIWYPELKEYGEKLKILCYGDSNTWGFIPGTDHQRFSKEERWPGALQRSF